MSTLRVNKLENTNTSNGGISIDTSGHVSIDGANFPTAGPLSNRNLIINGAMQVAQRGTSFTGVTNTQFALDRFQFQTTDEATYTLEQSSESPAGFEKSLKVTVTTADSSIEADDYTAVQYAVEGYDTIPLGFGAADAKYVTLSFWVRSSETGNFGLHVHNSGNNRDWDATYAVNSANTWEYKTITVPGDTAGTWLKNNGVGLKLWFSLLVGSTYEASAVSTSWGSTLALGVNGQVQLSSVLNATWQITGVQLEVGETATPFEHRSYGDELRLCQRYYYKEPSAAYHPGILDGSANYPAAWVYHPVEMRAAPTAEFHVVNDFYYNNNAAAFFTPSGGTTSYAGNARLGYANKQGISNSPGSTHSQKTGQWRVQLSFSAEL